MLRKIQLISYDSKDLIKSSSFLKNYLEENNIKNFTIISLPVKKRIYCVLRSPHADKDSREHFEIRIHKKVFLIKETLDNIISQKLFNIQFNLTKLNIK
jgi:small subunit ribosomal protein S10